MRLLATLLLLLPLCAQQPPAPGGRRGRAPYVPKNLKILKPEELMPTMRRYEAGLGVECEFCHVQGDRASDDIPKKVTARMMESMVRDINAKFPEGRARLPATPATAERKSRSRLLHPPRHANSGACSWLALRISRATRQTATAPWPAWCVVRWRPRPALRG